MSQSKTNFDGIIDRCALDDFKQIYELEIPHNPLKLHIDIFFSNTKCLDIFYLHSWGTCARFVSFMYIRALLLCHNIL